MSWNYRIIKHRTNTGNPELDALQPFWVGLHEVYYDDAGKINGYVENPEIAGESVEDIIVGLRLQFHAAKLASLGADDSRVLDEDELPKDDGGGA